MVYEYNQIMLQKTRTELFRQVWVKEPRHSGTFFSRKKNATPLSQHASLSKSATVEVHRLLFCGSQPGQ